MARRRPRSTATRLDHQADELVDRYLRLRLEVGQPGRVDPLRSEGARLASTCAVPGCPSRKPVWGTLSGKNAWLCASCGAAWPAFAGESGPRSTPARQAERRHQVHAELVALENRFRRLDVWETRLYLVLYVLEEVGGFPKVAAEANRRWPASRGRWTERRARTVIDHARAKLFPTSAPPVAQHPRKKAIRKA